jgi:hypothetical protein
MRIIFSADVHLAATKATTRIDVFAGEMGKDDSNLSCDNQRAGWYSN